MAPKFGTITRLPSKRYRARYTLDGVQLAAPHTFDTKVDAAGWLLVKQVEIGATGYRSPASLAAEAAATEAATVRFGPYGEANVRARKLRPSSERKEWLALGRILPTFGHLPLAAITPTMVRAWHTTVMGDRTGKTPGDVALAQTYVLLKSILQAAVADELISSNPCVIKGASTTKTLHKQSLVTTAQLATILAHMPDRYRLAVEIAGWCAPRWGEVSVLRRCDFSQDGTEIWITRAIGLGKAIPGQRVARVIGPPKTDAGIRDIAVPGPLAARIVTHIETYCTPGDSEALLFPSSRGTPVSYGSFMTLFKVAKIAAGRPELHFHDLRHTGGTRAAKAGATTMELMRRLGHTTAKTAMLYQLADRDGDRQIADGLAAMMTR